MTRVMIRTNMLGRIKLREKLKLRLTVRICMDTE